MSNDRRCPRCGSYAIVSGWGGALTCQRCGHVLAQPGQQEQYALKERRERQWKRVTLWLWPAAVLTYAAVSALFQQRPPWTLTESLGDRLTLWLIVGMFGVPVSYFLLLMVAGCAFNWITAYDGRQRLLGAVGVSRGAALALIALWSTVGGLAFGPVANATLTVGLMALMGVLLLLGPADSRRQLDMLSGLIVTLAVGALVMTLARPAG